MPQILHAHMQLGMVAAVLGMLSHLAVFIRSEWHMLAPLIAWTYSCLTLILFYIFHSLAPDINTSVEYTVVFVVSYCTGLFTSIVMYRKYFHRLRSFPGPWAAGITKLWHVWKCREGKNYLVIEELRPKSMGLSSGLVLRRLPSSTRPFQLYSMGLATTSQRPSGMTSSSQR